MIHNEKLSIGSEPVSPARLYADEQPIAMVYLTDGTTRKRTPASLERARRLVACWNACIGMSTEDVEAWAAETQAKRAALETDEAHNALDR
jgi:hypothetical protein